MRILRALQPPPEAPSKLLEIWPRHSTAPACLTQCLSKIERNGRQTLSGRSLHTVGGLADHLVDPAGLRQHRDVAGGQFRHICIHALGEEALKVGLDCPVLATDDVVCRLCFPRRTRNGLIEQVRQRPHLRGPYELLLRFGQIACEFRDPRRTKKQPAVYHLDMLEDGGLGNFAWSAADVSPFSGASAQI